MRQRPSLQPAGSLWPLRALGAIALFGIAADHLYEYFADHYVAIPTIGTLFLLNGAAGIALGLALLLPLHRLLPARVGQPAVRVAVVAGIGLAGSTLAGLLIAESTPLFGFMEYGYRLVVVLSIVAEVAAIVSLAVLCSVLKQP